MATRANTGGLPLSGRDGGAAGEAGGLASWASIHTEDVHLNSLATLEVFDYVLGRRVRQDAVFGMCAKAQLSPESLKAIGHAATVCRQAFKDSDASKS